MNYGPIIRKAYHKTTPEQRVRGQAWYKDTHSLCSRLAQYHGLSLYQTAGILAALSPMCNWALNVTGLLSLVKTGKLPAMGTYNANRLKAYRILEGERPAKVLGGPKVKSFYANILRPHGDAVTIDTWIARVVGLREKFGLREYREVASAIQKVAKGLGLTPCELQATIWLGIRDGKPDDRFGESLPLWEG